MKALITALATARLTQLVVDDEIMQPVRDTVGKHSVSRVEQVKTSFGVTMPHPIRQPFWAKVDEAINCHACTSVWAGAGILVAEQIPFGRFLVRVLALSQAALAVKSVIERIDR